MRTEFASPERWQSLKLALATPSARGARAQARPVDDAAFSDLAWHQLLRRLPAGASTVLFVADATALYGEGHPVRVVDTAGRRADFRCIASELVAVEARLPLQGRDWEQLAAAAGTDGVYRGVVAAA